MEKFKPFSINATSKESISKSEQTDLEKEESKLEDKKKKLAEIRSFVEKEAIDDLGCEIDEGIKNIVVAMKAIGFQTTQSCEGHCDESGHGAPAPWVEVSAPNEPTYQYNNQEKIIEEVAKNHGISVRELIKGSDSGPYWEAEHRAQEEGETEEYINWNKQNEAILERLIGYLKEFYDGKGDNYGEIIQIQNNVEGAVRIYCGSNYHEFVDELSDAEREKEKNNLPSYRKEMDEFAAFLLKKYFDE